MTMVALVRFSDADILLSDSRVSWGSQYSQDSLLKIFRIDLNKLIAYSGDIELASQILNNIGKRVKENGKSFQLEQILLLLPRVCKRLYSKRPESIQLIFGGYNSKGTREWFKFSSPVFAPHRITNKIVIIGSGNRVINFLGPSEIKDIETTYPELQLRTTVTISRFDKALRCIQESTVGGMLQVVSLYNGLCYPIHYGKTNIDQSSPPESRHMYTNKEREWIQHDVITNHTVPLKYPSKILNEQPSNNHFEDYPPKKPLK